MSAPAPTGIVAYIDGGARGNPGPAGYGVRVETEQGDLVEEFSGFLGTATNNIAEYNGLLAALRWAGDHGHRRVRIKSDSELLVKQMLGQYKVKNPGLQTLYQQAQTLARALERVAYEHVRREQNKDADRLANEAMDQGSNRPAADPDVTTEDSEIKQRALFQNSTNSRSVPDVGGAEEVAASIGEWPSFHDAEIIRLHLERDGISTLSIQLVGRHLGRSITFSMEGIKDLSLDGEDVNAQNVISSLAIEKTEQGTRVTFYPCFGLSGQITAESVTVRLDSN